VPRVAHIGLQLWTIRDECDRDLEGSLRRVGAQGYEGVELFQLHGHDVAQVRAWLDDAGLVAAGRHARLEALEEDLPALAAELDALGTDRVAIGWVDPDWLADVEPLIGRIEAVARAAADAELKLGFHNHWSEVVPLDGGPTFLDRLRLLPADLLWLELDLGWTWHAGADPVAELEASRGRCHTVHVKDFRSRDDRDDVPVGDGAVGYENVLPVAIASGAQWLIVEEDEVDASDPFGAVERSLDAVRRIVAA
jgi:sugar phosphate isomerase/epimerase